MAQSGYAQRMARLSARIFGEVPPNLIPKTTGLEPKVRHHLVRCMILQFSNNGVHHYQSRDLFCKYFCIDCCIDLPTMFGKFFSKSICIHVHSTENVMYFCLFTIVILNTELCASL